MQCPLSKLTEKEKIEVEGKKKNIRGAQYGEVIPRNWRREKKRDAERRRTDSFISRCGTSNEHTQVRTRNRPGLAATDEDCQSCSRGRGRRSSWCGRGSGGEKDEVDVEELNWSRDHHRHRLFF